MHQRDLRRWFAEKERQLGRIGEVERVWVRGYRLAWNYPSRVRGGGAANLVAAEGSVLPALALEVDDVALSGIDEKEGHPRVYRRHRTEVHTFLGGLLDAWIYLVTPEHQSDHERHYPTRHYLRLMREAAREHRLPASYRAHLDLLPIHEDQAGPIHEDQAGDVP